MTLLLRCLIKIAFFYIMSTESQSVCLSRLDDSVKCQKTRYRSIDGSCNNLRKPLLGTPDTRYTRLLPPNYGDGISTPTLSKSGKLLPGARLISLTLYGDVPVEDTKLSLNAMQYGQIITHDMSLADGSESPPPPKSTCCTIDGQLIEILNEKEKCYALILPKNDPIFLNRTCFSYLRTKTDRDRNYVANNQSVEQLTKVNHYLDLSIIYANTDQVSRELRLLQGGKLKVNIKHGVAWPIRQGNTTGLCCYRLGDIRVNQNVHLTLLHIVLLREHNRIADILGKLNPHWNDETIFQETRKITIAEYQFISYYEWLPLYIGKNNCLKHKIIYHTNDFVDDYSEDVEPTVSNEHANTAFRHFHSMIAGSLKLVDETRRSIYNLRFSDWVNKPKILESGDHFDELARGLFTQSSLASDPFNDNEITQFFFKNDSTYGFDLKSIDVQRNRDHGFAPYNEYRGYCGLRKAKVFEDFLDVMPAIVVRKLIDLYETPDDVDLTVGGSLETPVPEALVGPTFLCILTEQFLRTRVGDRFWFEHKENGLTIGQLKEIRKSSISRLLCDNGHHIQAMQPRGFEIISQDNPVTSCKDLPAMNLSLWKET